MIKWVMNWLGKVEKPTKLVMMWNGVELGQLALTESQYNYLMRNPLPMGFSIISEMDI
jgi:hypothetical protein